VYVFAQLADLIQSRRLIVPLLLLSDPIESTCASVTHLLSASLTDAGRLLYSAVRPCAHARTRARRLERDIVRAGAVEINHQRRHAGREDAADCYLPWVAAYVSPSRIAPMLLKFVPWRSFSAIVRCHLEDISKTFPRDEIHT